MKPRTHITIVLAQGY